MVSIMSPLVASLALLAASSPPPPPPVPILAHGLAEFDWGRPGRTPPAGCTAHAYGAGPGAGR